MVRWIIKLLAIGLLLPVATATSAQGTDPSDQETMAYIAPMYTVNALVMSRLDMGSSSASTSSTALSPIYHNAVIAELVTLELSDTEPFDETRKAQYNLDFPYIGYFTWSTLDRMGPHNVVVLFTYNDRYVWTVTILGNIRPSSATKLINEALQTSEFPPAPVMWEGQEG